MWIVNYVMIVVCSSLFCNLGCVLDMPGSLDELELLSCDVLALICCASNRHYMFACLVCGYWIELIVYILVPILSRYFHAHIKAIN